MWLFYFAFVLLLQPLAAVNGPISDDFAHWLTSNGYGDLDFARGDLGSMGSFGGRMWSHQNITRNPVIFVHGNNDAALTVSSLSSGWDASIEYLLHHGYSEAELYATTWGSTNIQDASLRTHDCATLTRVRKFILAVSEYTKAPKVNVISHSMGVTLARKAIKGGSFYGDRNCDLGKPLDIVDVFVGLSGANYGMCNCEGAGVINPVCNVESGFWPGNSCGFNYLTCGMPMQPYPCSGVKYSRFLEDLNDNPALEATRIVSAWSLMDEVIGYGSQAWGRRTTLIPNSSVQKEYINLTHEGVKTMTVEDQLGWLQGV